MLAFGDDNTIYDYYLVNETQLGLAKRINKMIESGCCGQNQCFACSVGGVKVKYDSCLVVNSGNEQLAQYVSQSTEYDFQTLIH